MALPEGLGAANVGFKTLFQKTFNETKDPSEEIAMRVDSSDLGESYEWLGDFPGMKEWVGDRTLEEFAKFDYSIKNKSFEGTVKVPFKDIKYDKLGKYKPAIAQMAQNCKKFGYELGVQTLVTGHLNNCYDGKKFFAADHAVGANTYSNLGNLALTEANLLAAYAFMMGIKNPSDEPIGVLPTTLMVGPQQFATAIDLVETQKANGNKTYKLVKVIVEPRITGLEWYLLDTSKIVKPIILQVAEEGNFTEDDSQKFMKDTMLYGADAFLNAGYGLWQLAYKSQGGI